MATQYYNNDVLGGQLVMSEPAVSGNQWFGAKQSPMNNCMAYQTTSLPVPTPTLYKNPVTSANPGSNKFNQRPNIDSYGRMINYSDAT